MDYLLNCGHRVTDPKGYKGGMWWCNKCGGKRLMAATLKPCTICGEEMVLGPRRGKTTVCQRKECRAEHMRKHNNAHRQRHHVKQNKRGYSPIDCDMTLDEVGQEWGVSRERVRQLEARALRNAGAAWKRMHPDMPNPAKGV